MTKSKLGSVIIVAPDIRRTGEEEAVLNYEHPIIEVLTQAKYGKLQLDMPDGQSLYFENSEKGPSAHLQVNDLKALDMFLGQGENGFAEAYMDELWESDDLSALVEFGLVNIEAIEAYLYGRPLYVLWMRVKTLSNINSLAGSKRNVTKHYDLGNRFYELWLDKSMTYSCALFAGEKNLSLEKAQQAKYNRILKKLNVRSGGHILEIGCGWGGFAEVAASKGIKVTGITISKEQKLYAEKRLYKAGLGELVKIELADYRKIKGEYDYVVSIGMFEHVGEQYWPVYFRTINENLKPEGKAIVQTITLDHDVFRRTHDKRGFIETYIFPGGCLPSKELFHKVSRKEGLVCKSSFAFGQDYALTLKHWLQRFNAREREIRMLGYDSKFIRMWRLYLNVCIAAFETGRIDVMQAELVHA